MPRRRAHRIHLGQDDTGNADASVKFFRRSHRVCPVIASATKRISTGCVSL